MPRRMNLLVWRFSCIMKHEPNIIETEVKDAFGRSLSNRKEDVTDSDKYWIKKTNQNTALTNINICISRESEKKSSFKISPCYKPLKTEIYETYQVIRSCSLCANSSDQEASNTASHHDFKIRWKRSWVHRKWKIIVMKERAQQLISVSCCRSSSVATTGLSFCCISS